MIQKIYYYVLLLIGLNVAVPLSADTWKVLFYMNSTDQLSDMAIKNMTDMIRGKPEDTVDFLIQLHAYHQTGLRYRVTKTGLVFIEEISLSNDARQNIGDAITWAFADKPMPGHASADHTMLILSNHGWGILDPIWNEHKQEWQVAAEQLSTTNLMKRSSINASEQGYQNHQNHTSHKDHKGFMFTVDPRTYLTSNELTDAVAYAANVVLGHKKLSIVAFDTCMGDMFEIGYNLAPYADYLVGSQGCALPDGFEYQSIMQALNKGLSPRGLVQSMVHTFDAYYAAYDKEGVYTHAALDLSCIKQASRSLNTLIVKLLQRSDCKQLFSKAAKQAPRFCRWPMYTDLIAFCKCLQEQVTNQFSNEEKSDEFIKIQELFKTFYQDMEKVIVARCAGFNAHGQAHGVAIYLPDDAPIAYCYYETIFAWESQWINLLEVMFDAATTDLDTRYS